MHLAKKLPAQDEAETPQLNRLMEELTIGQATEVTSDVASNQH